MDSFPIRFLTLFSIRSSRRLRNSLRSNILAARLRRVPLKDTWESSIFYGHIIHPPKPYALFFITPFDSLKGQKKRGLSPFFEEFE
jgi:hypothetical protein